MSDVLYRELLRLSLVQIAGALGAHYKQLIYYLNTFFKKMMGKYLPSREGLEVIQLSDILTKVS